MLEEWRKSDLRVGGGGILSFVFGQLIDISLAMSLILMSVSQLITVYHIIDPQSSVENCSIFAST